MREKIGNILWGAVLIALGVLIGGHVLGVIEVDFFFPGWWTLFIIIPCLIGMIKDGPGPMNLIFLLCGTVVLLERNDMVEGGSLGKILAPAVFLIVGAFLLFHSLFQGERRRYNGNRSHCAIFAGNVISPMPGEAFEGCEADAVFGGLDIDLRNTKIEDGTVIEATAVFGGVDIFVPAGVNVKVRKTELFGGVKNRVSNHSGQPVLYINAISMFGGVEIK